MVKHFAHLVRGSGPGLLLAHGSGGSVEGNFGTILDDLAAAHTVVGPDYPGAGQTPRSEARAPEATASRSLTVGWPSCRE